MDPIFYSSESDPYYSSRKNEVTKFKLKHSFIKQFIIFYSPHNSSWKSLFKPGLTLLFSPILHVAESF